MKIELNERQIDLLIKLSKSGEETAYAFENYELFAELRRLTRLLQDQRGGLNKGAKQ